MKKTLHYWIVWLLIRINRNLFDRYIKEYTDVEHEFIISLEPDE